MQKELGAVTTTRPIAILGVNGAGLESSNADMTAGRVLPWLQDTETKNVWALWNVTYRDVVILDAENYPIGVYNLTASDLGVPANFATLKSMLVDAANAE